MKEMNDLISRQAVLALPRNITRNMMGKIVEESIDVELIKALPPVQPKQEIKATLSQMEMVGDTISRQAAIDALDVLCQEHRYKIPGKAETYSQYNEAWQDALDRAEGAINNLPPVEPRLIRCRDCDWWTKQEASLQGRCALSGTYPTGAFFCGNARERGEMDDNN